MTNSPVVIYKSRNLDLIKIKKKQQQKKKVAGTLAALPNRVKQETNVNSESANQTFFLR